MATFIKLKQTPIKEIIFTISFQENVDDTVLEVFTKLPAIHTNFPSINKGFNTQVQAVNNQPPTAKVSVDGYILRSETPHIKLLQVRKGSLALHLVNKYENFDTLINELSKYWELLESCYEHDLTVNGITVRYLNFIELRENDNTEELTTINTKHPFGTKLENTFTQHRFAYEENAAITINVVSTIGKNDKKDGIVLDIILNKKIETTGKFSFDSFTDMREAKNDIFFRSITEKTIKRYNQ